MPDQPEALHARIKELAAHVAALSADSRTVKSLSVMLGWENVPPQDMLEAEIRAMKARIKDQAAQLTALTEENKLLRQDNVLNILLDGLHDSGQRETAQTVRLHQLVELVTRFRHWDMLDATADGPFWKAEIKPWR